jgi:hypothetical protein
MVPGSARLSGSYRSVWKQERETTSGSGHEPKREESAVMVLFFNTEAKGPRSGPA